MISSHYMMRSYTSKMGGQQLHELGLGHWLPLWGFFEVAEYANGLSREASAVWVTALATCNTGQFR